MAKVSFTHVPHPRHAERRNEKPPQAADEHIGFNGRLGAFITRSVGTMWAFYIAALAMGAWMAWQSLEGKGAFDPYPFAFLLFLGNIVQLLLMFVIMVGQQVLGAASDKRAIQTFKDAEAILAECLDLQRHLEAQDQTLGAMIDHLTTLKPPASP